MDVLERHLETLLPFLSHPVVLNLRAVDLHFSQSPLLPFPLVFDLSQNDFARLVERLLPDGPLQVETQTARIYPYGKVAAHSIGYAAPAANAVDCTPREKSVRTFSERATTGRSGVEEALDKLLRGSNGEKILLVDPSGLRRKILKTREPIKGQDVTLSIDLELQRTAEEALGDEMGCAVLTDVRTGEVLALANSPSYDLNILTPRILQKTYEDLTASGAWINQALQGLYPPGSVFKLVSLESLLRFGVVDGHTEHDCNGSTRVGSRIIRCHNHRESGKIPFTLAVAKSCNSFVIDNIFSIPLKDFLDEIRRFGFGSPTGIELTHETNRSLVPSPQWKKSRNFSRWMDGDTANLAIGQGYLLVTPLQINAFTASLAMRRERTPLTILKKNACFGVKLKPLGLTDENYGALLEGMRGCVEYGSGHLCHMEGIPIAGKTGTAQVRDGHRSSHIAWFTAFAPANAPEVAVTVMLREPFEGRSYGGGSDAAPVAKKILKKYLLR
jgi:penicillin-binding protein 2